LNFSGALMKNSEEALKTEPTDRRLPHDKGGQPFELAELEALE
jgi:hypothetical protein